MREPIDRANSWYYYPRHERPERGKVPIRNSTWRSQDFETCTKKGEPECRFVPGEVIQLAANHQQMMFFCGLDRFCREFGGRRALQQAKENVERHYAVDMRTTLRVLEHYVPRFFGGALKLYLGK